MDLQQTTALKTIGELLIQIRGIAGDATNAGHISALGGGKFDSESACKAIYALADAAHNLPDAIIEGFGDNIFHERSKTITASAEVFGSFSIFEQFPGFIYLDGKADSNMLQGAKPEAVTGNGLGPNR